jgi:lipopolysaccharide export system permease protein
MSFLGPFAMTFCIVLFLLLMQFLWRYIDELVGKGLGFGIIAEFLMYASATLVPLAMPLAVLLSSLMTFGNMGEFYELTAIKASGISLQRVMKPIVFLAVIISVGAFFFANNVVPIANLKMRTLRLDVKNLHPEVSITEGIFNKGIENYIIRVSKKDPVTNKLFDIKIYDHSKSRGNLDVTVADSGILKMTEDKRNMIITLWNGYKYTEEDEGRRKKDKRHPHRMLKFREQNIIIQMTGFELSRSDERVFKSSYQMLNASQLKHTKDSLKRALYMNSVFFRNNLIKNSFFRMNQKSGAARTYKTPLNKNNIVELRNHTPKPVRSRPLTEGEIEAQRMAARKAATQARKDLGRDAPFDSAAPKKDSVKTIIPTYKPIQSFDSLFTSFNLDERQRFVNSALNNVSANTYLVFGAASHMEYEKRLLRKHEIEWHRKFTLPFACLIFLFVGAPLGAIIRKGGLGLPTVISTLLFILYYIISLIGQKIVEESLVTPFQGMWLSSFLLIIAGVFLTYQATNDSAILNIETYLNWIREKAGLRKGVLLEKKTHITGKFELVDMPREVLQQNFVNTSDMALRCLHSLRDDGSWIMLISKSFTNTGFFYLLEFGIHYNSFIDQVILSKWFRNEYFHKRLAEFPLINGRITSEVFTRKILRQLAVIIFPIAIIRVIHLKIKIIRLQRNLKQVIDLCSGMVNLLNSSAFKIDAEIP